MMKLTEYEMREIFANNLINLRSARRFRLSQAALATYLNLSEYCINNYEQCKSSLNAYNVMLIADYFSCTVEEILTKDLFKRKEK